MKVVIRGVHLTVTPSLKEHVESQLVEPLRRLLRTEASQLDVQLVGTSAHRSGQSEECRVTLHIPSTPAVHLSEVGADMYKSISLLADRLENAAQRHLDKHRTQPTAVVAEGLL